MQSWKITVVEGNYFKYMTLSSFLYSSKVLSVCDGSEYIVSIPVPAYYVLRDSVRCNLLYSNITIYMFCAENSVFCFFFLKGLVHNLLNDRIKYSFFRRSV